MFRFAVEHVLYFYLAIPLLALFLRAAFLMRRRALERFGDAELVRKLSESVSRRRQVAKVVLVLLAVFFLITALARPQFGTRVETVTREGQDIVIALDLSASMLAEDIVPNRLEKAKHAVASLIDRLEGDRVGLVAFAGQAFVQSPLTVDYAAAKLFLDAMKPDLVPVPGTDLGQALDRSLGAFKSGASNHKVLILITDGEDHGEQSDAWIDRAVEDGVIVHTVGIGSSQGVPIPEFDQNGRRQGFKRDENGAVVTTRLDETTLQTIARETGGRYFRASANENELAALAETISAMDKRELDAQQVTQFEEQYRIFLGFALVLLVLEVFVSDRRRATGEWRGRFA